jgi:6-phosphogluconolactonase/glucosamine-6-phosphate isomerase/deaminase/murein DD-endopeptidase MepM/ murein hydrolase activator NlpD/isopentenyldiphosphate isomerase
MKTLFSRILAVLLTACLIAEPAAAVSWQLPTPSLTSRSAAEILTRQAFTLYLSNFTRPDLGTAPAQVWQGIASAPRWMQPGFVAAAGVVFVAAADVLGLQFVSTALSVFIAGIVYSTAYTPLPSPLELKNPVALAHEVAALIRANNKKGLPTYLITPTGSTPIPFYAELARLHKEEGLDFSRVHTFNMDEYYVGPDFPGNWADHPQSYRHFMKLHLFSQVNIPDGNTHFLNGQAADPLAEARRYEDEIQTVTRGRGIRLALGGVGSEGHVAFNEAIIPIHDAYLAEWAEDQDQEVGKANEFVLQTAPGRERETLLRILERHAAFRQGAGFEAWLLDETQTKDEHLRRKPGVEKLAEKLRRQPVKIYFDASDSRYPQIQALIHELSSSFDFPVELTDAREISNSRTRLVHLALTTIIDNSRFFENLNDIPIRALTVGLGTLRDSEEIAIMATGKNKARPIANLAIASPRNPLSLLYGRSRLRILIDRVLAEVLGIRQEEAVPDPRLPGVQLLRGGRPGIMPSPDERIALADPVTGAPLRTSATRKDAHARGLWHQVVHVYVRDKDGRLILPRRNRQLSVSPGKIQASIAGHVDEADLRDVIDLSNPEWVKAVAAREGLEEFGIRLDKTKLRLVSRINQIKRDEPDNKELATVLIYDASDEELAAIQLQFNINEVEELAVLPAEDLRKLVISHPDEFSGSIRHLMTQYPGLFHRLIALATYPDVPSDFKRDLKQRFLGFQDIPEGWRDDKLLEEALEWALFRTWAYIIATPLPKHMLTSVFLRWMDLTIFYRMKVWFENRLDAVYSDLLENPVKSEIRLHVSTQDMIELKVRMKPKNGSKPEFLYQQVPLMLMDDVYYMGLQAQRFSFPHKNHPITREEPAAQDQRVTIRYRLTDNSYNADRFTVQGHSYEPHAFFAEVEKWVNSALGDLRWEPLFHVQFIPSWEEWKSIIEAEGYVPDPTGFITEDDPDKLLKAAGEREKGAGVVLRLPVHRYQSVEDRLSYSAEAEVLVEKSAGEAVWLPFSQYQDYRAQRAALPREARDAMPSWLSSFRLPGGLTQWSFEPGMLFGAVNEWWRNRNKRMTIHEGIDLYSYVDAQGQTQTIPEGMEIPALLAGEVVQIFPDILGQSILVRHTDIRDPDGRIFYTFYVHVDPSVKVGDSIQAGQVIARVAPADPAKGAPAHLHFTTAWIPENIDPSTLGWDHMNPNYAPVHLINPLQGIPLIDGKDGEKRVHLLQYQTAALLRTHYYFDDVKANQLAMLIETASTKHINGATELWSGPHRLVEISQLGTRQFFDTQGRWLMTLDPYGRVIDQLRWDEQNRFKEGWTLHPSGRIIHMEATPHFLLPIDLVRMASAAGIGRMEFHPGIDFNTMRKIPYSTNGVVMPRPPQGVGFAVMRWVAEIAKHQGNRLYYAGSDLDPSRPLKDAMPHMFNTLREVTRLDGKDYDSLEDIEPHPPEVIFHPNGLMFTIRDHEIQRIYYEGNFFLSPSVMVDYGAHSIKRFIRKDADTYFLMEWTRQETVHVATVSQTGELLWEAPALEPPGTPNPLALFLPFLDGTISGSFKLSHVIAGIAIDWLARNYRSLPRYARNLRRAA